MRAPRFPDGASLGNASSEFVVGAERGGWESLLGIKSVDSRNTKTVKESLYWLSIWPRSVHKGSSLSCGTGPCTLVSRKEYWWYQVGSLRVKEG